MNYKGYLPAGLNRPFESLGALSEAFKDRESIAISSVGLGGKIPSGVHNESVPRAKCKTCGGRGVRESRDTFTHKNVVTPCPVCR